MMTEICTKCVTNKINLLIDKNIEKVWNEMNVSTKRGVESQSALKQCYIVMKCME